MARAKKKPAKKKAKPRKKKAKKVEVSGFVSDRVSSMVPGLDRHIEGGFVQNSINMVSGGPGTGKTIFAMHFAFGSKDLGEKALFVSFEENLRTLKGDAQTFGWDFDVGQKEGYCYILAFRPMEKPEDLNHLLQFIKKKKITRVVIDSISVFSMMFRSDQYKLRKHIYAFMDLLKELGCTVLVTAEIPGDVPVDISSGFGSLSRDGIVEFVADSVITMHNSGLGGEGDRAVRILKMRRTSHERSPIPMNITKNGMQIEVARDY